MSSQLLGYSNQDGYVKPIVSAVHLMSEKASVIVLYSACTLVLVEGLDIACAKVEQF